MKESTFQECSLENSASEGFFSHSLDKDVSCACPLQGNNKASIRKMRIGNITQGENVVKGA
jgi:hypothetical protein